MVLDLRLRRLFVAMTDNFFLCPFLTVLFDMNVYWLIAVLLLVISKALWIAVSVYTADCV